MKKLIFSNMLVIVTISLFLLPGTFADDAVAAQMGACEKGLVLCAFSTLADLGCPAILGLHLTYCFNGYAWCKAYVEPYS